MKPIAIHNSNAEFHNRWISYCQEKQIPYTIVNCLDNDIVQGLLRCGALMWHHFHNSPQDIIAAKRLLFALEQAGISVFPDFNTSWHFDDKIGQKYLLESINAPIVPTYVFYNKKEALAWVETTIFPKVWKLSRGAGSQHVKLVQTRKEAVSIVRRAFTKGFSTYNSASNLSERWRKYKIGQTSFKDVVKGVIRIIYKPAFTRNGNREKGYVYFQDFVANNDSDIRIIVIGRRAFGIKRYVRMNDFRASGSGKFSHKREDVDERCIQISFQISKKLQTQCLAFDYIFHNGIPLIVELSYGFSPHGYEDCPGYWDDKLNFHEEKFNPYGWMIDLMYR